MCAVAEGAVLMQNLMLFKVSIICNFVQHAVKFSPNHGLAADSLLIINLITELSRLTLFFRPTLSLNIARPKARARASQSRRLSTFLSKIISMRHIDCTVSRPTTCAIGTTPWRECGVQNYSCHGVSAVMITWGGDENYSCHGVNVVAKTIAVVAWVRCQKL